MILILPKNKRTQRWFPIMLNFHVELLDTLVIWPLLNKHGNFQLETYSYFIAPTTKCAVTFLNGAEQQDSITEENKPTYSWWH